MPPPNQKPPKKPRRHKATYLVWAGLHDGVMLVDEVGPCCPLRRHVPHRWLLNLQRDVEASVRHKLRCQWVEDKVLGNLHAVKGGPQFSPGDAQQALVLVAGLQEVLPHFPVKRSSERRVIMFGE